MVTYCTTNDIALQLNMIGSDGSRLVFDTTTTPTSTEIESLIEMAESVVDQFMQRSWKLNTVTDEMHHLTFFRNRVGYPQYLIGLYAYTSFYGTQYIRLNNAHIRSITALEIYDGDQWIDYIANKTESTEPFGDDYYVNYTVGEIYINDLGGRLGQYMAKVSYTWGETTTVPPEVKQATILIASSYVLARLDSTIVLPDGGKNPYESMSKVWYDQAMELLDRIRNNYGYGSVHFM